MRRLWLGCCLVLVLTACALPLPRPASTQKRSEDPWATPTATGKEAPRWQRDIGLDGSEPKATVVGDKVVVTDAGVIVVLAKATGNEIWRHEFDPPLQPVGVADGVVALVDEGRIGGDTPDYGQVEVLDLADGESLWRRRTSDETGSIAVFSDAVYTRDCPGPSEGCSLSRRALRTGKAVWTRPTSDVGKVRASDIGPLATDHGVRAPSPGRYLPYVPLIGDDSKDRQRRPLDPRTGRPLPAAVDAAPLPDRHFGENVAVTTRTLVQAKGHSDADGCRQQMVGYQVRTGERRWQGDVFSCPYRGRRSSEFGKLLGVDQATMLATDAAGRPMAVDLDTGRPRWTGKSRAQPIDAGRRWVLARATAEAGPISGLDAKTGNRVWQLPEPDTLRRTYVLDDDVVLEAGLYGVVVLTAETRAEEFRLPRSNVVGAGSTWLVARDGSRFGFYELGG